MADRLYLSYWVRGFSPMTMLQQYEKMLRLFPFSRLRRADSVFRIHAIAYTEPLLLETPVTPPVDPSAIVATAAEFPAADVCYEIDSAWDLWAWDQDWKLAPSPVTLSCYGPKFETEEGENLRIDFGLDEQFLPGPGGPESVRMVRDNIQSLLRLVHDIDNKLKVERRQLWSESGENFADRLHATLLNLA
jgi:hypothetical protein